MTVAYDAGFLIAADRNDRTVWGAHRTRLEAGLIPITTAPVVAQVSRTGRQAQLRQILRGCQIDALTPDQAYEIGALMGRAGTTDVVDAHLMIVAAASLSTVLTTDLDDLRALSSHLSPTVLVQSI
jgi:hypothetical protein